MSKVTAQVAAEAIANLPDEYDRATVATVLADGIAAGVSDFYLDILRDVLT